MTTGSKYHRKGSEVWRWFWAVMRKLWSPCMHSYMVWVSQNCIWNNQVIIYPFPFSRLPRPFLQTNVWCPHNMLPTPLAWKTAAKFALCWRGKHSGVTCLCHPHYPVYLTNLIMLHIVTLHSLTHYVSRYLTMIDLCTHLRDCHLPYNSEVCFCSQTYHTRTYKSCRHDKLQRLLLAVQLWDMINYRLLSSAPLCILPLLPYHVHHHPHHL